MTLWGHFQAPHFKIFIDASVALAGSPLRICRRIRNNKKIAMFSDFPPLVSLPESTQLFCLRDTSCWRSWLLWRPFQTTYVHCKWLQCPTNLPEVIMNFRVGGPGNQCLNVRPDSKSRHALKDFYTQDIFTRIFLTLSTFLPFQFCKNCGFIMYGFSLVWLMVLILFHAILEQSINNKMVCKI